MKSDENASGVIPREEWDFSRVPFDQLEACFAWEYARDCDWILDGTIREFVPPETITVNTGGKEDEYCFDEIDNPDYEDFLLSPDEHVGCIRGRMLAENCYKLKTPWQGLDRKMQDELIQLGTPEVIGLMDLNPQSYEFRIAFGLEPDRESRPWFDFAALRINWDQSDKRLLQDFADWLKRNRKKSPREMRGRNRRDALNMLGAMRLLHAMPLEDAIILTTRTLGEPLYGKRPSWERARKAAREIYREEFLTNPNDEDEPISYPKYIKEPVAQKES